MTTNQFKESLSEADKKLWTVNFILICLSALASYIGFHSLIPTLPIYIQNNGGSKETVGLALAFLTIAAVIIRPVTGWALDNYGRKLILIIGLLTFLLPTVVYISIIPIVPLLFFRLIQGFGWGICSTSHGTVATDVIPPSRLGEGVGFFGLTTSISLAAAPAIGLWLVDTFSFRVLFIISSILTAISLLLAMLIDYPKRDTPPVPVKLVFIERAAFKPSLVMLLVAITYSSLLSFLVLYVLQKGMSTTGLFFTTFAITTLVSRPFAGKLVDRKGRRGYDLVVLSGLLSMVAAMLVLAETSTSVHLLIGGILYGIGFGFLQPTMLALAISSVGFAKRGTANATYWTAFDIGIAIGSIFWGIIANSFGYGMMFKLNIIPTIIALVIYLFSVLKEDTN